MPPTVYLKTECEHCRGHIEYPSEMAGQPIQCPHCQHMIALPLPSPPPPPTTQSAPVKPSIRRASSVAGIGCLLQGLGVVCLSFALLSLFSIKGGAVIGFPVFGLIGLWLLFYGSRKATWLECSACGGKLSHRRVTICPHCKSSFQ